MSEVRKYEIVAAVLLLLSCASVVYISKLVRAEVETKGLKGFISELWEGDKNENN